MANIIRCAKKADHYFKILLFQALIALATSSSYAEPSSSSLRLAQTDALQTLPPPSSVELAFSPKGGATALVIKAIASAQQNIRMAIYALTSPSIATALLEAHKKGIEIEIVVDHEQASEHSHSVIPYLARAGIPLRIDTVHALLHDKYIIVDGKSVETGSFNFTKGAEQKNAENVLVLWNDPALAAAYAANWQSLWDKAVPYGN